MDGGCFSTSRLQTSTSSRPSFPDPGPAKVFVFLDMREDSIDMGNFAARMTGWPTSPHATASTICPASIIISPAASRSPTAIPKSIAGATPVRRRPCARGQFLDHFVTRTTLTSRGFRNTPPARKSEGRGARQSSPSESSSWDGSSLRRTRPEFAHGTVNTLAQPSTALPLFPAPVT